MNSPTPSNRARSTPRLQPIWLVSLATTVVCLVGAAPPPAAGGEAASWDPLRFLGRFHPLVLHLPIGFLAISVVLDLLATLKRSEELHRATSVVLLLTAASAITAAACGWLLAGEGGYDEAAIQIHRWGGVAVATLVTVTAIVHRMAQRAGSGFSLALGYRALLVVSLGAIGLTGHTGGDLTHGKMFLFEHAPPGVRDWYKSFIGEDGGTEDAPGASTFASRVRPVLEAKCGKCHFDGKAKGGYRMDDPATLLAGGESGQPAIVPGNLRESRLVELILLPRDDEDAMPPLGRDPLTPEEILDVAHWIADGAEVEEDSGPTAAGGGEGERGEAGGESGETGAGATVAAPIPDPAPGTPVDFVAHVQPILERNCVRCHGPDRRKGRLRLHTAENARAGGGDHGAGIVADKPDESSIVKMVSISPDDDPDEMLMPPAEEGGPLPASQIATLRRWIEEGASWPDGVELTDRSEG